MPFSLLDSFKEQNPVYSILLVDDDPNEIRYLTLILENAGYNVVKARCAKDALKILETATPDLIFSDLNMPGMDGIEFCKTVYLDDAFLDIPLVFISAINDALFRLQATEAGAVDYISKPFSPEEILQKVDQVLNLVSRNNLTDVLFVAKDSRSILEKQKQLREKGIVVSYVDSAKMAIESIHTQKYNLVLSEPQLLDTTAFEFCKILKEDAFKNIPFITYSENVTSNMYSEGIKFGVNDFWNSAYSAKELALKIQSYLRKYSDKEVYPKGISKRLDIKTILDIVRQITLDKKTGILSVSNAYLKGHIHFNEGQVTDAFVGDYEGVEAFYTLMTIGRGGFYRFVNTNKNDGPVSESSQNLYLYAEKLLDEIKKIWEKEIEISKTSKSRPKGMVGQFIKEARTKKMFWQILRELEIDAYHGFLILEKLIVSGKVISPVKELLLMDFGPVEQKE
jgi:CheY-like chemotaxis protein